MNLNVAQMAVPTTYLALGGVLTVLAFLTFWREMLTSNHDRFFPRTFAFLAFLASRVLVVVFSSALVFEHMTPPLMYVGLHFIALLLAVETLPQSLCHHPGDPAGSETRLHAFDEYRRKSYFHTAIFALVGAFIYSMLPGTGEVTFSLGSLANSALIAATLPLSMFLLSVARSAVRGVRLVLVFLMGAVITSWVLVLGASFSMGSGALAMLQIARACDVLALVTGLLALQSNSVLLGSYHKTRAELVEEEAERARAELNQLNRVASDIYEDSSSMINRQQAHSRDLMRRIDNLERILQIGVKIQRHKDLRELLQTVVELVSEHLGFRTVIVRLLNERTQSFETKGCVGVNEDARAAVTNHRMPLAEFEVMTQAQNRIGNGYFIKSVDPEDADAAVDEGPATVTLVDEWRGIEQLLVPLKDQDSDRVVGYLTVEDPIDQNVSVVEAIENLDAIADLAVVAIRTAQHTIEVGEKNRKLKTYTEKLSGLNQMKANFVATISHEFRTPLTSIKAYCETLLKNADNVDRNIMREFLTVIGEESDRLMTLIEDILDFSQMESGAVKFERTPCDLREIANTAVDELSRNFAQKNITLKTDFQGNPKVRGERELMKQLLVNLLSNASKFTPADGNVTLSLEDESVSVRIVVEDDGIGIREDQLDEVFEHFHQADNTSTRRYGGTGIGLAICKNIVDWHDGRIWVESAPGQGARFVVVLPKKQIVVRNQALAVSGTMRQFEVERYLEAVVEMVAELISARKASIMLVDESVGQLKVLCAIGMDEEIVDSATVDIGEGIAGKVVREKRSYLVEDIDKDSRVTLRNNDYLYDSKSFISVPIRSGGRVYGVINVANPLHKEQFSEEDARLLEVLSERVDVALSRLREYVGLTEGFDDVRTAFKAILDVKRYVDDQTDGVMNDIVRSLSRKLGMTEKAHATLKYLLNVYDLGLSRSGYSTIRQPRDLSVDDRKTMEQHTEIGTELLRAFEPSSGARNAVLYHHENFDGSGYPAGLSGEEIPLESRIIRIVDTFRALISMRPYQQQYTVLEALEVLKTRSGTHFDPRIVDAFVEAVTEHIERLDRCELPAVPGSGSAVEKDYEEQTTS